jgi:hypothetical protein
LASAVNQLGKFQLSVPGALQNIDKVFFKGCHVSPMDWMLTLDYSKE